MAAHQGIAEAGDRAGRGRDARGRLPLLSRDAGLFRTRRRFPAFRPRRGSGATPMACRTSSPPRWTTRCARSAICTRASGFSRWSCSGGSDRGAWPKFAGADLLNVDKFMRTLGFYREAESELRSSVSLGAEAAAGLCRGDQRLPRRATERAAARVPHRGARPEPWKPADSLVIGKLLSLELSNNYKLEALRAHLRKSSVRNRPPGCFPAMKPGAPITTEPALTSTHASSESIEDQIGALIGVSHGASNEWVDRRIADR